MTPEVRAARDRITAYLEARRVMNAMLRQEDTGTLDSCRNVSLRLNDLRTVLAALDHLDTQPAAIIQFPGEMNEEHFDQFRQAWDATIRNTNRRTHSIDPGMGILSPSVAERAAEYHANRGKPHGHPWHACATCSPDGMHAGKGCHNCRQTGYDQTPCRTCADDPDSRVDLGRMKPEEPS